MPPNSRRTTPGPAGSRAGIALIVVLGFLSVLIIMAVGFAISMRVERLIARSNLDHIRALQLGEAALARAVSDIDTTVGDAMFPEAGDWADGVLKTSGSGAGLSDLLTGHATNYVPRSMWADAVAEAAQAKWVPFDYLNNRIGQYAYIIIDSSGLIDVNADYSRTSSSVTNRWLGGSVYELQMNSALLQEVTSNWKNMVDGRTKMVSTAKPWFRMETAAEIMPMLSRGYNNAQPLNLNQFNYNFITYSRFPSGYRSGANVLQPTFISSNSANYQATLAGVFAGMGIPNPTAFINNLIDYVDPGNTGANLDSFATEAVPLVNEIVVSNSYQQVGTNFVNTYQLQAEVWYPFTTTNTASYSIRLIGQYLDADPGPNPSTINLTIPMAAPGGSWTLDDFLVVTSAPVSVATPVAQDLSAAIVRTSVRVLEGNNEVDRVGGSAPFLAIIKVGELVSGFGNFGRGLSADDPRINWNGADPIQWRDTVAAHTLGAMNANLTTNAAGADGHTLMYVANRPLQTVGELGLLLYDATKPWTTISLLNGANYFPVLDQLTLTTNTIRQGLVNPNGFNANVLATVFNQMQAERVPYDPAGITFSTANAQALGQRLADKNISFTNLTDLKHMGAQIAAAMPAIPANARESVVRNSAGLFSPRQQLYTIILAAQSLDDNGFPVAEKRGVGLIWRDPYTTNGTHATFVRNFRWLTE